MRLDMWKRLVHRATAAVSLGPNAPWGTPAGKLARVRAPHSQPSSCSSYSVTSGRISGSSTTWWILGSGSIPRSGRRHRSQRVGTTGTTRSAGSRSRLCPLWPGCPPRARPVGSFASRGVPGGSDDGGFDEFWEFCPRRASNSATCAFRATTSRSSSAMRASRGSSSGTGSVDHILHRLSIPLAQVIDLMGLPGRERLPPVFDLAW